MLSLEGVNEHKNDLVGSNKWNCNKDQNPWPNCERSRLTKDVIAIF